MSGNDLGSIEGALVICTEHRCFPLNGFCDNSDKRKITNDWPTKNCK